MFGPIITARYDRGAGPIDLELCLFKDEKEAARTCVSWFADPRVQFYLNGQYPFTLSNEEEWIRKAGSDPNQIAWGIYANGDLIGSIGLGSIDKCERCAELGIVIGDKSWWGRGIAAVTEMLVCEYAFSSITAEGLHRLFARAVSVNEASKKALQKVGFREIGLHRESRWACGRWFDIWTADLLQREWQSTRDERFKSAGVITYNLYPGCDDVI